MDRVQTAIDRVNRVPDLLVGLECVDNPENGKEIWDWQGGVQSFQKERVTDMPPRRHEHRWLPGCPENEGIGEHRNVGVLVSRVETLWWAGKRWLPDLLNRLERLGPVLGTSREQQILSDLYQTTPFETLEARVFPFLGSQLEIMAPPKPFHHVMKVGLPGEGV